MTTFRRGFALGLVAGALLTVALVLLFVPEVS